MFKKKFQFMALRSVIHEESSVDYTSDENITKR
jgi:hypothetical protein